MTVQMASLVWSSKVDRRSLVDQVPNGPCGGPSAGPSGDRSNGLRRRQLDKGLAPVFSFEPGRRLISQVSTSALAMVMPTTITTGPIPELPRDAPSTLLMTMADTLITLLRCG